MEAEHRAQKRWLQAAIKGLDEDTGRKEAEDGEVSWDYLAALSEGICRGVNIRHPFLHSKRFSEILFPIMRRPKKERPKTQFDVILGTTLALDQLHRAVARFRRLRRAAGR